MATIVTVIQHVLTAIVVAPTLAACCLLQPKIDPPVVPIPEEKKTVNVDPFLLKPCGHHLAKPEKGSYTELGTLNIAAIWDQQFTDCSKRQDALADIVQKAFNIDARPPADAAPVIKPDTVNK